MVAFLKPLSYLGPYSFRSWVMDTFCPFLGNFGRSVIRFRHILQTIHDTGREVYRSRQIFIAKEGTTGSGTTQFNKTDVLSNLGMLNPHDMVGPDLLVLNSQSDIQRFYHDA